MSQMPAHRYRPFVPISLPDRTWPNRTITHSPRWCSVDLGDGNQGLAEPMGLDRKRLLFAELVRMGFKEIEVGFPSVSAAEFDFVRAIIEENLIPEDVTIQVVTPARPVCIRRTFEAIVGARRAIIHLHSATSPLHRRLVLGLDRSGSLQLAVAGAQLIKDLAATCHPTHVALQYSPTSFTVTEPDFALAVCEAVADVWQPTASSPLILNLPATVELSTPNVYADQIEWFGRHFTRRASVVLSVHPHNDRGCAVAAAELGLMAGADRVEGTLFGNGERTGNVDVVTLALNMLTQGIDPGLDIRDIDALVRVTERCTRLPVHPRHPYAGALVFTAFSRSHQDGIRKGMAAREERADAPWEVPYLPIDPADLGRTYESLVRINSQSGRDGVGYLLEAELGCQVPRELLNEFSRKIQQEAEATGREVPASRIREMFKAENQERKLRTGQVSSPP